MMIQNFETDPDVLALSESVMNKKCVIFFGAGVSLAAGFPSWESLIQKMRKGAGLNMNMDYGGYLRCADYCKRIMGNGNFYDFLKREFGRKPGWEKNDPHLLLAKLPCKIYITTNYDTRMEDALEKVRTGENVNVISSDRDIKAHAPGIDDDCIWVIKMHGCIRRNYQEIVIGESDYLEYETKYEKMYALVSRMMQGYNVLFLGYSISDWNMSKILYQCHNDAQFNKYFLQIGSDSNVNNTISRLISLYGIKPIVQACPDNNRNRGLVEFLETIRKLYMIPEEMAEIINSLVGYQVAERYNRRSRLNEIFNSLEVTNIVRFLFRIEQEKNVDLNIPQILKNLDDYTIADVANRISSKSSRKQYL